MNHSTQLKLIFGLATIAISLNLTTAQAQPIGQIIEEVIDGAIGTGDSGSGAVANVPLEEVLGTLPTGAEGNVNVEEVITQATNQIPTDPTQGVNPEELVNSGLDSIPEIEEVVPNVEELTDAALDAISGTEAPSEATAVAEGDLVNIEELISNPAVDTNNITQASLNQVNPAQTVNDALVTVTNTTDNIPNYIPDTGSLTSGLFE